MQANRSPAFRFLTFRSCFLYLLAASVRQANVTASVKKPPFKSNEQNALPPPSVRSLYPSCEAVRTAVAT